MILYVLSCYSKNHADEKYKKKKKSTLEKDVLPKKYCWMATWSVQEMKCMSILCDHVWVLNWIQKMS